MFSRGIAVVAITRRGVETALKIQTALHTRGLPCKVYALPKYAAGDAAPMDMKLDVFLKETYAAVDALVGVMAAGIIIRAVAPLLKGKLVDPAVLCVDANGKFVISLLSGHYGGANQLARQIAAGIDAAPVITTASDSLGKQSVDELAKTLHLTIVNPKSLIAVNAAVVDGERVALVLVGDVNVPADAACGYAVEKARNLSQALKIAEGYDASAIVAAEPASVDAAAKPIILLKPKTLIMGLGARKEVSQTQIFQAIYLALAKANVPLGRISRLATVDIKKDSQSMLNAAQQLGLKLDFVRVDALRVFRHEDLSADSALVLEKIGVGGVCEQAALIKAGKNPHLILKKQKHNGVTVAIAEGE